jgi:hypothetical protein
MIDRRGILKLAALTAASTTCGGSAFAQGAIDKKPRTRIVFLGTKGGPRVGIGASNPANAVIVNGTLYVIDCGMGVSRQLVSAGADTLVRPQGHRGDDQNLLGVEPLRCRDAHRR